MTLFTHLRNFWITPNFYYFAVFLCNENLFPESIGLRITKNQTNFKKLDSFKIIKVLFLKICLKNLNLSNFWAILLQINQKSHQKVIFKKKGHRIAQTSPKLNFFRQIIRFKSPKQSFFKIWPFLVILLSIVSEKGIYPVNNMMKIGQNSKNWA